MIWVRFLKGWEFVALRAYNLKKPPARRFFTLQTPKACPLIVVFMAFFTKKAMKTYKCNRLLGQLLEGGNPEQAE
jgi:hypothetical protein